MKKIFKYKKQSWFFSLSLSFIIHIALVLLLYLKTGDLWPFFKKDIYIATSSSIHVDMVGLPDLLPKKVPSSRKNIKLKNKDKKKKSVKKKPKLSPPKKKLLKPEPVKKPESKKPSVNKSPEPKASLPKPQLEAVKPESSNSEKQIRKGNKIIKGDEQGEEVLNSELMSAIYTRAIKQKTKAHWNLPKYLTDSYLTTQIEIRINKQGHVIYKQIVLSSGNDMFDSYVLKAIEDSTPYPVPPDYIQDSVQDGIVFILDSRMN